MSGKRKPKAVESDTAIVSRNWERYQYGKDRGHYEYIQAARLCEDFYLGAGLQWTPEDKAYLDKIGRPAQEQNHIFPAVNSAKGLQLQSRVDIAFRPAKEGSSEQTADTLGKVVMQICSDTKFRWHETQAFDDGIIQRRGFLEFKMDFNSNLQGDVVCESINPLHVIPDPDASSYDPAKWSDIIVLRWLTIDDIEMLYGYDKARECEMAHGNSTTADTDIDLEDMEGFAQEGATGIKGDATDETSVRRILVVDRQHKRLEMQDAMVYASGDVITAEGMSPEQIDYALEAGAYKTKRYINRIRWTVTTGDCLLHDDWSPYRTYSIIPYFPYFRRGRNRSMVDNAISPQIACNKIMSQVVHILNSTANSGWVVEQGSLTNMTLADLEDFGATTGVVVEYAKGATPPQKISPNPLPLGHEKLIDRSEYAIKTITGMSDAVQGQPGNEVSGIAIETKQYMGQAQMGGPLDNLARTRDMAGMKILELIQDFYTERRVIMIKDANAPMDPTKFTAQVINDVDLDGNVINDLTIGEYSVVITDQPTQATFMDNQFRQAIDMRKEGIQVPDTAIIEMSSLSKKNEIIKAMTEQQPAADPLNDAKAADLQASADLKRAQIGKVKNEMVNVGVDALYSAVQAAGTLSMDPRLGPLADDIARSAGFQDQNAAPIIPSLPAPGPMQGMEGMAAQQLAGGAPMPIDQVQPQAPVMAGPQVAPVPDTSGPDGMQAGIETPRIEGVA